MVVYVFNQKELCFLGASLRQYFLVTTVKLCWPKPAPLSPPCIDPQCGVSMKLELIVDLKNETGSYLSQVTICEQVTKMV